MRAFASPRRRARLQLLGATLLFALGLDAASLSSRPLMLLSALMVIGGAAWFVRTLVVSGRPDGVLHRNRREIALASISTLVTLVLVLVLSLGVRLGPRHFSRDHQRYDADLGWASADEGDVVGQRQQTIDHGRGQVVVMGDSILYGHGVKDDETAAFYLGEKLPNLQVLNLSVSGYSIDQYYLTLKRTLPRLQPRLVIVGVFAGNDYQVTGQEYSWGHSKPFFVAEKGRLVRQNPDLLADNCIDHLAQSLLFRVLWTKKELAVGLIHLFCQPRTLLPEEHDQVISLLFDGIESVARAQGSRVLFVLLPTRGELFDEDLKFRSHYRDLRRLLVAGHRDFFEFYPDIHRSGQSLDDLYLDDGHYKPPGHRLLADSLFRYIKEHYPALMHVP